MYDLLDCRYSVLSVATGKIPFHIGTGAGIFPPLSPKEATKSESDALASYHNIDGQHCDIVVSDIFVEIRRRLKLNTLSNGLSA